jgi:hypothetical protein
MRAVMRAVADSASSRGAKSPATTGRYQLPIITFVLLEELHLVTSTKVRAGHAPCVNGLGDESRAAFVGGRELIFPVPAPRRETPPAGAEPVAVVADVAVPSATAPAQRDGDPSEEGAGHEPPERRVPPHGAVVAVPVRVCARGAAHAAALWNEQSSPNQPRSHRHAVSPLTWPHTPWSAHTARDVGSMGHSSGQPATLSMVMRYAQGWSCSTAATSGTSRSVLEHSTFTCSDRVQCSAPPCSATATALHSRLFVSTLLPVPLLAAAAAEATAATAADDDASTVSASQVLPCV